MIGVLCRLVGFISVFLLVWGHISVASPPHHTWLRWMMETSDMDTLVSPISFALGKLIKSIPHNSQLITHTPI